MIPLYLKNVKLLLGSLKTEEEAETKLVEKVYYISKEKLQANIELGKLLKCVLDAYCVFLDLFKLVTCN